MRHIDSLWLPHPNFVVHWLQLSGEAVSTLFVSDLPWKAPPTLSTRSFLQIPQLLAGILLTCSLASTLFGNCSESVGFAARSWVLQRSFMGWPSLTPSACANSILFLASHGSFHRRARLVEAPCASPPVSFQAFLLLAQASNQFHHARLPHTICVDSRLFGLVEIRWPELWLDAKQRRKYFPGSSPRITTQHNGIGKAGPSLSTSLVPCHPVFPELSP